MGVTLCVALKYMCGLTPREVRTAAIAALEQLGHKDVQSGTASQLSSFSVKSLADEQNLQVKIGRIATRARAVQYQKPVTRNELEEALSILEKLHEQNQIKLGEYTEYKQLLSKGIAQLQA